MGNSTFGSWRQERSPGIGSLHPDGVLLGGLRRMGFGADDTIPLSSNPYPAHDSGAPWTVTDGAKPTPPLQIFSGVSKLDPVCEGPDAQIISRAVEGALSKFHASQDGGRNINPYSSNFARVVDPGAINTDSWQPRLSIHGAALESPAIPDNPGFHLKMYRDPDRGNAIAITPQTWSWPHVANVPGFLLGSPVNAGFARRYLGCIEK